MATVGRSGSAGNVMNAPVRTVLRRVGCGDRLFDGYCTITLKSGI